MCICVLDLFFAVILCIGSCILLLICSHFVFSFFFRCLPVQLGRVWRLLTVAIRFFLRFGLVITIILCSTMRFVLLPLSNPFFFARFMIAFFCCVNQLAISICSYSFSFCLVSLLVFLLPNHLYTFIPYPTPLPSPAFLRMIHSSHHDHPCTLPALFRGVHMLQIHAFLTHLLLFLSCFFFPLCPCIHPHPSAPMYAHLHPLTSLFAKLAKT